MTGVGGWFEGITRWLKETAQRFMSFWGVVFGLIWGWLLLTKWAFDQFENTISDIDFGDWQLAGTDLLLYGRFIDRFIPLTEGLSIAVLFGNIMVLVVIWRWVKSFIPTLSN